MTRSSTIVGVIVGEGAPLLEIAVAPRVFDLAASFELRTAGERPGPLGTTGGIGICPPLGLDSLDDAGLVVVPGWRAPDGAPVAQAVLDTVRRAHDDGATVVGLCLGAFVLAEAGLLDGRRATTHWRYTAEFAARYPTVAVVEDALFVDEGDVLTSAGSAAGLDACLHLLRRDHGPDTANTVARALLVAPQRAGGQAQLVERPVPRLPVDDPIAAAMRYALDHIDDPKLDITRLATATHLSRRTFDRRFRETTATRRCAGCCTSGCSAPRTCCPRPTWTSTPSPARAGSPTARPCGRTSGAWWGWRHSRTAVGGGARNFRQQRPNVDQ